MVEGLGPGSLAAPNGRDGLIPGGEAFTTLPAESLTGPAPPEATADASPKPIAGSEERPAPLPGDSGHERAPIRGGRTLQLNVDTLAWAISLLIAVLTRLPSLGALPLTLSDSARAFAAWQVANGRLPDVWSGDLAQTLTAGVFKLFGASDGLARLAPALLGIGLVAVLWFFRPAIGRASSLLAALLIALSPICVAVSRSLSPYAAGAIFATAAAAALLTFLDRPRPAPLAWLAGLLGLGLSTDASFLVFVLAAVLFCLVEGLWKQHPEFQVAATFLRMRGPLLRSTVLIGLAGLLFATTRFGLATDRLRSGAMLSWSQAFVAPANAAPWHFAFDSLFGYELLLWLAGLAGIIRIILLIRSGRATLIERFLLYWAGGAFMLVLVASRREMGQIPMLLVPLALAAGIACVHWLASARRDWLEPAIVPSLLAIPAFVYVLFELEGSTLQSSVSPLQLASLPVLILGGIGLLTLGAFWSGKAAPAYITTWCLVVGLMFALHGLTRIGFRAGDEFLLGPVATANAPALAQEINRVAPSLGGAVSLDPRLSTPLAWYTRNDAAARFQAPTRTSGGLVLPVEQTGLPGFQALIPSSEVARAWYPADIDLGGMLRWLLYRRAWGPVRGTSVQFLIRSQ